MSAGSAGSTAARPDLSRPYQLRAIRIGVIASVVVLAAMTLYPMLPGEVTVDGGPYAIAVIVGFVGVGAVATAPWAWILEQRWGMWCLYGWSVMDIVLVTSVVAMTGFERSELFLLYIPIVVFYAASYPVRSQFVLSIVALGAYVAVLRAGPPVAVDVLFFRFVATAAVFSMASFLAREMGEQARQHARARADAERRAAQLAVVASAARELQSRSTAEVLQAVADAVLALGFDAGGIAVQAPGEAAFTVVQARGAMPPGDSWWPAGGARPSARGGVTVRVDGGPPPVAGAAAAGAEVPLACRIAVPVRAAGGQPAVLLAGSARGERLGEADREALDLLASRAARALEHAAHADELERSERRLRSLVQNASDLITVIDAAGIITYQSDSARHVLGRAPSTLLGRPLDALVHPDDFAPLAEVLRLRGPAAPGTMEVRLRDATGAWRRIDARLTDLRDDPAVGGVVLNGRDVTERHRLVEQLGHQARHDELTQLPNRAQLHDRLADALARAAAASTGALVAVLFVDLDDFKALNDLFGHPIGDTLLVEIGRRFRRVLPPDVALARFGGDEFTAVVEGVPSAVAAEQLAARLLAALEPPLCAGEAEVHVGASIGIAIGRGGAQDADELLRRADIAMYAAKGAGKRRAAVFDAAMEAALLARHELERDLRLAVAREEFELHFQPVVALDTGAIEGVESLVRWRHPVRGLVPPGDFIPLAEETALIVPLGRLVLRDSCRQLADWRSRLPELASLRMAINVSTLQLLDAGFPDDVAATLAEFGVPGTSIVLEITEATLAEQQDTIAAALARLKRLGVAVAIDDFGTGYSSLGYLGTFPVDSLKIDRSFISRLGTAADAETLVGAVIDLAKRLRLSIVAEGIEQPLQVEHLRSLGCMLGQGFLFSRPYPAREIEPLLTSGLDRALAA